MSDLRIIKRELVMRLTTAKGSVLYEPIELDTRLNILIDLNTELGIELSGIKYAWKTYKQAKLNGEDGANEFVVLALRLDRALAKENNDE